MGAPFYLFWRGPGLTFGIGEVQGSLLERWWLPFWTQSLQRFSFKRASRSHAKTGDGKRFPAVDVVSGLLLGENFLKLGGGPGGGGQKIAPDGADTDLFLCGA